MLLAENPLLLSIVLGILAVALVYGWLQSGRKPLVYAGLFAAALIPIVWVVAENWVTDRERIEQLIGEVADAVEANDHDRALAIIGDEATKQQAAGELPQWIFTQADVGNIRSIQIIENTMPLEADVDMTVKVEVSSKRGSIQNMRVPRRLMLTFQKRGPETAEYGGWKVTSYRHLPIIGKADGFTTQPVQ